MTGATGTVGSEVLKQLTSVSSGTCIRAAVHSKNKAEEIRQYKDKGVEIAALDHTKPKTVTNALIDVNKLFLQTLPVPGATDICSNIVREAKKNGVNYIVKLSAMGADSKLGSTILRLHGESGIPYTFLRPPAFMQNFITQFGQIIRTRNAFYAPAGEAKMSFVDTRDIAAIAVAMLMNGTNGANKQYMDKVFDTTGQEALSYSQVAEILSNGIGRKISYIDIPEDAAKKD